MDADPRGPSYSEWFRHQCEVRYVLSRRCVNAAFARAYLDGIEAKRGKEGRLRVERDARDQWARGNRGAPGDWREPDQNEAL